MMATTASSKQNRAACTLQKKGKAQQSQQIFDVIRQKWVCAYPEEIIRQQLVQRMISSLGYPQAFFAVEKALCQLPHLAVLDSKTLPQRRLDILCFAPDIHPDHALYPLLMIECKAVALTEKVLRQVIGYNLYIQAPFIAVANESEVKLGWFDASQQDYCFINFIPPYQELLRRVKRQI